MSANAFNPVVSSNEVWRGEDTNRCLTDDLDFIEEDIKELKSAVGNLDTVEVGSDGLWEFKKFGNGRIECEARLSVSGMLAKSYYDVKYNEIEVNYPVELIGAKQRVYCTAECEQGVPNVSVYLNTNNKLGLRISNPADLDFDVNVYVRVVGKWK